MFHNVIVAAVQGTFFQNVQARLDSWVARLSRRLLARATPVNPRKVMFVTFQGDYTCNPRYISQALQALSPETEIVWSAGTESQSVFPEGVKVVSFLSYDYFRQLAGARVIVTNSSSPFFGQELSLKKGQHYIQTWHGSLGLKRFDTNPDSRWRRYTKKDGRMARAILSNSDFEDGVFRHSFWPTTEIWKIGHPRNDVLLRRDAAAEESAAHVRRLYGLEEGEKIFLYAPTFRESKATGIYNVDMAGLQAALEERFGGKWRIMVRLHYALRAETLPSYGLPGLIDATLYPDIQDLLLAADAGLTDYSSWIFDFMLTGKPCFLYTPDLDDYNQERGFCYPIAETPFAVCRSNRELQEAIRSFDEPSYALRREEFLRSKGCVEDGHASERAAERILSLLGS